MIVDGKSLARDIAEVLKQSIAKCPKAPVLGIVMIAPTAETRSFVRIKKEKAEELGILVIEEELQANVSQEEAEKLLQKVVLASDGVVLQQPIPSHLNNDALCASISPKKDIDALTENSAHTSPVAGAVQEILSAHEIQTKGVAAVVIGSGKLVGIPVAKLLRDLGAEVVVMTKETGLDIKVLSKASIVVSGAGNAGLITKEMLSKDAVVIDAGTSESMGSIKGDVDTECYEYVRLISPVPGGVGPLTVVSLFKNLVKSASCP
jgi:methylenetetrahydrofolate dehydrogenase (NADP+)/methenyltetrahydrofolate cyclohydrolase